MITQKFTSANGTIIVFLFWWKLQLIYSVLYTSEVWEKAVKRETIQNILIKPHQCQYLAYNREICFTEAGEFLRQVKLIIFLLLP